MNRSPLHFAAVAAVIFALGSTSYAQSPVGTKESPRVIPVGVLVGQLKYDTEHILVQPGESVIFKFENKDEMPHNLVFCDLGVDIKKVADEALKLGAEGLEKHYLPEMPEIIAATPLVMQNNDYSLPFTAPEKEGDYPYVCTFPGHFMIMKGILQVGGEAPTNSPLRNLTYKYYEGSWRALPDFTKLTPKDHGAAKNDQVDVNGEGFRKDHYAVLFNGELIVPKTGKYVIRAASDDGGRILIDGKVAWEQDGLHGMKASNKRIELTQGAHPVEIQFFEFTGGNDFRISWSGPGVRSQSWTRESIGEIPASMVLEPIATPVIYRNFFTHARGRGIGIGYPERVNALFDAGTCRWKQLWRDDFVNASVHWVARGLGAAEPAGGAVVDLFEADPAAILADPADAWPSRQEFPGDVPGENAPAVFAGYDLDARGRPTMLYNLGAASFTDTLTPVTIDGVTCFKRSIDVSREDAIDHLYVFIGRARKIESLGDGRYAIGDDLKVQLSLTGCRPPEIRANGDGFDLVVPVNGGNGEASIQEIIQW